jgi:hypothetical protein
MATQVDRKGPKEKKQNKTKNKKEEEGHKKKTK